MHFVFSCIDADFCDKIRVGKLLTRSTRLRVKNYAYIHLRVNTVNRLYVNSHIRVTRLFKVLFLFSEIFLRYNLHVLRVRRGDLRVFGSLSTGLNGGVRGADGVAGGGALAGTRRRPGRGKALRGESPAEP